MLQKEEKIVAVLLVMAVLSLIIAYAGFFSQAAHYSENSKIGERVLIEGILIDKYMTSRGDNLIMSISDLDIKIFISKDNGAKDVYKDFYLGDKLLVSGRVALYRNAKEIVVESASDIKKI